MQSGRHKKQKRRATLLSCQLPPVVGSKNYRNLSRINPAVSFYEIQSDCKQAISDLNPICLLVFSPYGEYPSGGYRGKNLNTVLPGWTWRIFRALLA